ncbi:uncharacterized protein LOC130933137 [Arachis stenosperma]|uniref:uncharacterized protein LOC130933137 n=1 Tax=Arachis stenosperma TaxID=217475 RepID=UPI0025ACEA4D|nr:uncharacterized protein LOC130933137 [Arachis stenosperma]
MSVSHLLVFFFAYFPGLVFSAVVTLSSIEIFTTHEWLKFTPTVYFKCNGENKTVLPDVKKKNVIYVFRGEESWQPLTNFSSKKCKRCGLYEEDKILADDVFDEWELCPSDFTAPLGKYEYISDKEFNASLLCPDCLPLSGVSTASPPVANDENLRKEKPARQRKNVAVIVVVSVLGSAILIVAAVGAFKFWQKRKREQDQARFLKLFEEGDDIEDELHLDHII